MHNCDFDITVYESSLLCLTKIEFSLFRAATFEIVYECFPFDLECDVVCVCVGAPEKMKQLPCLSILFPLLFHRTRFSLENLIL